MAHRKGRSRLGAAVVTLLVPLLGILAVLLVNPAPDTGRSNDVKAKVLFGLLPLWLAIGTVVVVSFSSRAAEYWYVAPWLIVAAIPVCIVTLTIVELLARRNAH